jgi:hypothetical protein
VTDDDRNRHRPDGSRPRAQFGGSNPRSYAATRQAVSGRLCHETVPRRGPWHRTAAALDSEGHDPERGELFPRRRNAEAQAFTSPEHGFVRKIALTDPARERLLSLPRESEFAFTTLRGSHYRPSSRSDHWNRVR